MTDSELARTRTWAEVDLDALEQNVRTLRGVLGGGTRLLAVCKADAYGHGAVPVARKLQECGGVDMLAVASVQEGLELREGGISLPILCLGQSAPELAPLLWGRDITQAVGDLENGRALSRAAAAAGKTIKMHVKLDTGMGRIGFYWPEGAEAQGRAADGMAELCRLPGIEAEGLFTHFADAGSRETTLKQLQRFNEAAKALEARGVTFPIRHCAASVGVLDYPEARLDMGRFGLALYGYASSETGNAGSALGLKPVMTVKSCIAAVRDLPAGTPVSYGGTAVLKRDSRLAVLPVGYADGYPRDLSNKGLVRIHGELCPVVGRVCMDMLMADVTDVADVKAGDTAVVLDEELLVHAVRQTGTIIHEIISRLMPRIPRVYIEKGA